jgi:PAS domain S-box-containing protein
VTRTEKGISPTGDRFRILSDAMHAFAEATTDPKRLAETIARRLADEVGDACAVLLRSDDGRSLNPIAIAGPDGASVAVVTALLDRPFVLADHVAARHTLLTGEALLVPHLDAEKLRGQTPNAYVDFIINLGVHSLLAVSLRVRGEPIGLLSISRFRQGSPPFDEADRELAQTLADHAALAMANARSHVAERAARAAAKSATAALRIAEARFTRLSESGIIGILVAKLDGTVVEANERVASLIGYSREELLSGAMRWTDLTPEEFANVDRRAVDQLTSTGVAGVREKEYLHKDGHRVPVLVGSAITAGTEAISFVLDLSEKKRADKALADVEAQRALAARISGLLDAAPDAMVTSEEDGTIVFVNSQAEKLFGYTRTELIGRNVELLVPARSRPHQPQRRAAALADRNRVGPTPEILELDGLRRDGTEFPAEVRLAPTVTPDGILFTVAVRDVTERRKTEEMRARLAAIVDSSHDAIIGKTLDGIIMSWNRGAERLFGYDASEAIGRFITLLIPPDRMHEESDFLEHLREGRVRELETVRVRKDGVAIDVSVTSSPIRDDRGKVIGASKVARDISDRKRNEAALLRAKERAELANHELEAFSYSVAHDLRAPLRGMNGFAQLLVTEYASKLDAEGRDWLDEILRNSMKMGELIDALLSLSRLTRAEIRKQPVDLSEVARDVAAELSRSEPQRIVDVVVADDLHALADPTLVRSLVQNLLANAWKFTSGVRPARIEVGVTESAGTPAYFVRDNGAGFEMAFAAKLFTPFQRLHTLAEFPGTGIGLANVQRIVHRHGGRVWAEGHVGAGASFFFTLPEAGG